MVMVYAGTNNVEKYSIVVLEEKFRLLGRNLKAKTSPSQKCCLFHIQGQLDKHKLRVSVCG